MKRWLTVVAVLILAVAFLGSSVLAEEKLVLKKYPDLKIGFTTANFLQALPVSLTNAKVMVDFAYSNGFPWIELRDPTAKLTLAECKEIAAYAKARGVEVGYAAQIGLLDAAFWEIMSRAVPNAAVFEGPKTVRSLAFGGEFNLDPKKQTWNLNELYKLVKTANKAGNLAKGKGLQYVAEHAMEALKGDGVTGFGFTEFLANTNSNVKWQMDIANFFAVSRVVPKPEDAKAFLEKNVGRLGYSHLKSSSPEHKTTDVLQENELPIATVFDILAKNKVNYLAIELTQKKSFDECAGNLMKSIDFLKKNS
jgi:sugar phosphate isomerase/epimerase